MTNRDVRLAAAGAGVRLWQVAEMLGITEFTLSRRLRHELSASDKQEIMNAISVISGGDENAETGKI